MLLPFSVDKRVVLQRRVQGYAAANRASTLCCTLGMSNDDGVEIAILPETSQKRHRVSIRDRPNIGEWPSAP
jgi:hypothetical protein